MHLSSQKDRDERRRREIIEYKMEMLRKAIEHIQQATLDDYFIEPQNERVSYSHLIKMMTARIRNRHSEGRVEFILRVQDALDDYDYRDVYTITRHFPRQDIQRKAGFWARDVQKSGIRLFADDFESEWYMALLDSVGFVSSNGTEYLGDYDIWDGFFLVEHLEKKFRSRCLNLIRDSRRKKRNHNTLAEKLPNFIIDERPNPEEYVVSNMSVESMLSGPTFSAQEVALMLQLIDNPDATLQELAGVLGTPYRQSAKRAKERLKTKLQRYLALAQTP